MVIMVLKNQHLLPPRKSHLSNLDFLLHNKDVYIGINSEYCMHDCLVTFVIATSY